MESSKEIGSMYYSGCIHLEILANFKSITTSSICNRDIIEKFLNIIGIFTNLQNIDFLNKIDDRILELPALEIVTLSPILYFTIAAITQFFKVGHIS